jgi:hypothetical protein
MTPVGLPSSSEMYCRSISGFAMALMIAESAYRFSSSPATSTPGRAP